MNIILHDRHLDNENRDCDGKSGSVEVMFMLIRVMILTKTMGTKMVMMVLHGGGQSLTVATMKVRVLRSPDHTGVDAMVIVRVLRFNLEEVLIILAAEASDFFDKIFVVGPENYYVPRHIWA